LVFGATFARAVDAFFLPADAFLLEAAFLRAAGFCAGAAAAPSSCFTRVLGAIAR
jgi:hypothetical protein